jgi:anthranilate phosphoribosyltransferase
LYTGLDLKNNPAKDIVLVNAAAAIFLAGKAETIKEGLAIAKESIKNGSAYEKLRYLIKASDGNLAILEDLESHA